MQVNTYYNIIQWLIFKKTKKLINNNELDKWNVRLKVKTILINLRLDLN